MTIQSHLSAFEAYIVRNFGEIEKYNYDLIPLWVDWFEEELSLDLEEENE